MPATDVWPEKDGGEQSVGVTLPQVPQMPSGFGMEPVLQFPGRQDQDTLLDDHLTSSGMGSSYDEDFLQQWGRKG